MSETCLARTNLKWTEVPVLLHFNFLYEPRHDWQYRQLLAPLKIPKLWTLVSEFLLCFFFSSLLYCLFWIYQEGMSTKKKIDWLHRLWLPIINENFTSHFYHAHGTPYPAETKIRDVFLNSPPFLTSLAVNVASEDSRCRKPDTWCRREVLEVPRILPDFLLWFWSAGGGDHRSIEHG